MQATYSSRPPSDWLPVCKEVLQLSQPLQTYVPSHEDVQAASIHIKATYFNKDLFLEDFVAQELRRAGWCSKKEKDLGVFGYVALPF